MGMERMQGKGNQERFVIENVIANGNQSSSTLGNSEVYSTFPPELFYQKDKEVRAVKNASTSSLPLEVHGVNSLTYRFMAVAGMRAQE